MYVPTFSINEKGNSNGIEFNPINNPPTPTSSHACKVSTWAHTAKVWTQCVLGYAQAQVLVAVKPGAPSSPYQIPTYVGDTKRMMTPACAH
jgi:hypothetical protein